MSNDIGVDDRLDAFYSDLGSVDLQPLWTQTRWVLPTTPKPAAPAVAVARRDVACARRVSPRPHHDRAWR